MRITLTQHRSERDLDIDPSTITSITGIAAGECGNNTSECTSITDDRGMTWVVKETPASIRTLIHMAERHDSVKPRLLTACQWLLTAIDTNRGIGAAIRESPAAKTWVEDFKAVVAEATAETTVCDAPLR